MQPDEHGDQASAASPADQGPPAVVLPAHPASGRQPPARLQLPVSGLVARARGLIRSDRRVILGIAGAPGAGKSTVAEALRRGLAGLAAVVSMDGFHLAQPELVRLGRQDRKGAPDTFDSFGYAALLKRLKDNTDPVVYAPAFRRDLEEPISGSLPIGHTTPLVITEGNYLLLDDQGWKCARQQVDEVWFLDLPDEIRQYRLVIRHQEFGKDPGTARRWSLGSDQANAAIVRATQTTADLIITVTDEYGHDDDVVTRTRTTTASEGEPP